VLLAPRDAPDLALTLLRSSRLKTTTVEWSVSTSIDTPVTLIAEANDFRGSVVAVDTIDSDVVVVVPVLFVVADVGDDGAVGLCVDVKELLASDDVEALYEGELMSVNCAKVDATVDGCWVDELEETDVRVVLTVCNVGVVAVEPAAASDGVVELLAGDTVVGAEPATVAGSVALINFDDVELVVT
jgi:hypothetical protein